MSNMKSFRNLLSSQTSKNYKISPNNYPKTVKLPHLDLYEDNTSTSCSIDGIYSIKANNNSSGGDESSQTTNSKNESTSKSNGTNLIGLLTNNLSKYINFYYNCKSRHCLLTYLTPVACR